MKFFFFALFFFLSFFSLSPFQCLLYIKVYSEELFFEVMILQAKVNTTVYQLFVSMYDQLVVT